MCIRDRTDADARQLSRQGIPLVDISGGLHASEIAGSQHTPQLAYELLSRAAEPDTKQILDNTILFLWPSINPDGQDIVVNWCRESLAGRNPPPMEVYQKLSLIHISEPTRLLSSSYAV